MRIVWIASNFGIPERVGSKSPVFSTLGELIYILQSQLLDESDSFT